MQRVEFETLISEPIAAVAQALDTVVAKAGLQHDDIGIVLRTGGSSLIPAVNDLLTQRFSARVVTTILYERCWTRDLNFRSCGIRPFKLVNPPRSVVANSGRLWRRMT